MRPAILTAPRTFELRDATLPDPGPGEVLIRVADCAVCGSEFPAYLGRATAMPLYRKIVEYPFGHEGSGRAEVRRCTRVLGADGGYIMEPSKPIMEDVPVENAVACIETMIFQNGDQRE